MADVLKDTRLQVDKKKKQSTKLRWYFRKEVIWKYFNTLAIILKAFIRLILSAMEAS